ncbi:GNAT family N-acetyltransferase [Candidatus Poribacteria bacterium]|nr:GNAT family N-acetyltransferase [Candidatus Poribacteria bacterium]
MYRLLETERLRTDEDLEIGVIVAPDADHIDEVTPFLAHKPPPYDAHIRRSLAGPLDELETYFYVGKRDGRIITNIMTVEHGGVGILGHVYTTPGERRKGACDAVMRRQMDDFRARGGKALHLGTGFDSAAYHIYRRNGFKSVYPRSGFMRYFASADFDAQHFARRDAAARPMRWSDWGPMTAITGRIGGDWLRSVRHRLMGPVNFEGGYLSLLRQIEQEGLQGRMLVTTDGRRVGFATVGVHPLWRDVSLLDLHCHPNFWDDAKALWTSLDHPSGKVQCYADETSHAKVAALEGLGFRVEARLEKQIRRYVRPDWRPDDSDDPMFDDSAADESLLDAFVLSL